MIDLRVRIAKAKAKVKADKKRLLEEEAAKTLELEKAMLIEQVLNAIELPEPGKDGRDAPTLEELVGAIKPLLPKPEVKHVVEKVDKSEIEDFVADFIEKKLPDMEQEYRPAVEVIREEVPPTDLSDYITKKDLDDALRRVQRAIEQSSGSGGGIKELVNVVQVSETTTIADAQLVANRMNIVLVNQPNITLTLPTPTTEKIILVQQGYNSDEQFTVCYS